MAFLSLTSVLRLITPAQFVEQQPLRTLLESTKFNMISSVFGKPMYPMLILSWTVFLGILLLRHRVIGLIQKVVWSS